MPVKNKIAKFFKVTVQQFDYDWIETVKNFDSPYDRIKLPRRATTGSAGYDFFSPLTFDLKPGETIKFPTGIRVKIDDGWVLMLFPRSGLGFKYRLQLDNTVGIIDSDYFNAKNEGHMFVKLTNCGNKPLHIDEGDAFMQGVFVPYGITVDDDSDGIRTGGFGSTGA